MKIRRIQVPALLLAVLMLLLPAVPALAGGFTIRPASVNGRGAPGATGDLPVYVVSNSSGRSIHVTMAAVADPKSGAQTPGTNWFEFRPAAFDLAPGAEREVRGLIRIPADASPGKYAVFIQARGETPANSGLSLDLLLNARLNFTVVDASPARAEETAPAAARSLVPAATAAAGAPSATDRTLVVFRVIAAQSPGGGGGGTTTPSVPSTPTIGGDSLTVETTTDEQGRTVQTITVEAAAAAQVEAAKKAGETTVEIKVEKIEADVAEITVPAKVLESAAGMNVAISTPQATLELPPALVQALAGQGLTVQVQKGDAGAVEQALGDVPLAAGARVLGTPTEIKTAIKGRTMVTIPLAGVTFPDDPQEREAFLTSLAVFAVHSDGEKQVIRGEIVRDEKGNPTGIKFPVDKFSTFAVVKLAPRTVVLTLGQMQAGVNGRPYSLDAVPFVTANYRTMVPVRFVGEALGATVDWKATTNQVVIKDGTTEIVLTINGTRVLVNGRPGELDAPAQVRNNRSFVPLRFVSETLGARVDYDAGTRQITVTR